MRQNHRMMVARPKQDEVEPALLAAPELSNHSLALHLGVTRDTVTKCRTRLEREGRIPQTPRRVRADGHMFSARQVTRTSKPSMKLMSRRDVADLLAVCIKTVQSWGTRGQLPEAYCVGGSYRYDADEIVEWVRAGRIGSPNGRIGNRTARSA